LWWKKELNVGLFPKQGMKYLVASQVDETGSEELKKCGPSGSREIEIVLFDGASTSSAVAATSLKVKVPPLRILVWHTDSHSHPALEAASGNLWRRSSIFHQPRAAPQE
jgi:hypothetical protein